MRFLENMKIGKRLGIGFGITSALILIMVVTGIICLGSINSRLDRIAETDSVKLRCAHDIRVAFSDVTYLIGSIVTSRDASVKEGAKARIGEIRQRYKVSLDKLEALETDPKGKELIAKLKEEVTKGKEANNSAIELGMSGGLEEAAEKYGSLTRVVEGYMKAAEDMVQYNEAAAFASFAAAKGAASRTRLLFIILGPVALALGVLLSLSITRTITVPIIRSSSHIDLMAKGDFTIPVSEHAKIRKDEMGIFARSMDAMNVNIRQMLVNIQASSGDLITASEGLSVSAEKLSLGAANQVDKAQEISASSGRMTGSSEEMERTSDSISESAGQTVKIAREGQDIVHQAIGEVNLIAETVQTASEFVKVLGQQSDKIGDIVITINEIADQTNLLALNAAIEAARAGEHGRGFAVVADEVKKLAERTSTSTTEIGAMINAIREGVGRTVESMERAKQNVVSGVDLSSRAQESLKGIIESIDSLYSQIRQTAAAIKEMNAASETITQDVNHISEVTKETLSSSEEISRAASGLSGIAGRLKAALQTFKV